MPCSTKKWISSFLRENLNKFDYLNIKDINSRTDVAIVIMEFILINFYKIVENFNSSLINVIHEKILELKDSEYEGCIYEKKAKLFGIMDNILIMITIL